MMEGIELSYRPSSQRSHYPLTFDQRLIQGDRYREAAQQLDATLQSIEQFYASSHAKSHTGSASCERCAEKERRINQAYRDYYLGEQPGRWDEYLDSYRREIYALFDRSDVPLEAIHQRFKAELKEHLRNDMCTPLPGEHKDVFDHNLRLDNLLQTMPVEDALATNFQEMVDQVRRGSVGDATHALEFNTRMNGAKTNEERAALYVSYYCTPTPDDTTQIRSLKTKYAKLFESGKSHDTVLGMWKAEAKDLKAREIGGLEQRLGELKMAQSAHLKNKKKKKMKKDAKMMDRKIMVECSLPGCEKQMDKSKGGVDECAVCDWLAWRTGQRQHFYYCSVAHCTEDFDTHDQREHACSMGDQCYYSSPPHYDESGICAQCFDSEVVNFFCSEECFSQTHHDEAHGGDTGMNSFIKLELVAGMKLSP